MSAVRFEADFALKSSEPEVNGREIICEGWKGSGCGRQRSKVVPKEECTWSKGTPISIDQLRQAWSRLQTRPLVTTYLSRARSTTPLPHKSRLILHFRLCASTSGHHNALPNTDLHTVCTHLDHRCSTSIVCNDWLGIDHAPVYLYRCLFRRNLYKFATRSLRMP
jgi:hypothetical protein